MEIVKERLENAVVIEPPENLPAELTYQQRLDYMRQTKLAQTRAKVAKRGQINTDDHGMVLPPEDWHWEPTPNHPSGGFFGMKSVGENFRSLLEAHPVYIDPMCSMAGAWMVYMVEYRRDEKRWPAEFDYSHLREEQIKYNIIPGIGATSHFSPDYRLGVKLGWGAILDKIRHYRALHGPEKVEFYDALENVVLGIQNLIQRHADAARKLAEQESHPQLRKNLEEIAETNAWIVSNPPRTFREACQWIAWYDIVGRIYNTDGAGDQLDELLRPYYERDVAAGILDDEEAIFHIACMLLKDPHYFQIAGPAPDGHDQTSRVSFLALEAAHRLGIPQNLTVRVHDGLDPELFQMAVRYLFQDKNGSPRFSGDKGLTEGFMRNGYPAELARQRIAVGCHWMALPGREYTLNDTVKINFAAIFDAALRDMMSDPTVTPSVDTLWRFFEKHMEKGVLCVAKGLDFHLAHMKDVFPELFLDLLCHGPIEKGLDATDGGVEFYNMCIDGTALATVADSFAAIEQRIEKEKRMTWEQLMHYLDTDWAGMDGERARLMMKNIPRYGTGGSRADEWAVRISQLFTRTVKAKPTPGGRIMVPGLFSWASTIPMGKAVGATPNGRHAYAPISHGANPDPGLLCGNSPTGMANAVASVQSGYGNTTPLQLDMDPAIANEEEGIAKLAALIRGHEQMGGTLMNINVLNKEKILAAHENPELYPDLIVRVTGFSAYWSSLSKDFRQLVVDRIVQGL